jgi:hypothetical protein
MGYQNPAVAPICFGHRNLPLDTPGNGHFDYLQMDVFRSQRSHYGMVSANKIRAVARLSGQALVLNMTPSPSRPKVYASELTSPSRWSFLTSMIRASMRYLRQYEVEPAGGAD